MRGGARGQSEVIGVVLLTGVIVVLTFTVGAVLYENSASAADADPLVNIDGNATSKYITITHAGGDTLDTSDAVVILRGEKTERYRLENFTQIQGGDTTAFEAGDKWRGEHGLSSDEIEILVVDEESNSVVDSVTIDVEVTIAARFDTSPRYPKEDETITFDGSKSEVKGSTITNYDWEFGDGDTGNSETVDKSYSENGSYDVTLTVKADDGRTANRTKTVRVYNERPNPSFSYTPSSPDPGDTVSFDATDSTDPDGSITSYEWSFADENDSTGETTTHTYSSDGNYTVSLEVTDNDGATRSRNKIVSVGSASPPDVTITSTSISSSGQSGKYDVDVTFESSDPDGDITNYTAYLYNSSSQTTELDKVVSTSYGGGEETITLNDEDSNTGESPLYVLVNVGDSTDRVGNASATVGSNTATNQVLEFQSLSKGKGGEVNFDIKNNGSDKITVTEFAVDATDIDNNAVIDNSDSAEVKIDGTDRANSGPYTADGTKYSLDSDAEVALSDGDVTVYMKGFEKESNGNTLEFELEQVDTASEADLTVTLGLVDGKDQKFYFKDVSQSGNGN